MPSLVDWQKPYRWAVKPGQIDPRWLWVWRGLRWFSPFWEGGGIRYQNIVNPAEWFQGDATPPSWGRTRRGMALAFDGSDDSGNTGAVVNVAGTSKMTLAFLLDFPTTNLATRILLEQSTNYNTSQAALVYVGTNGTISCYKHGAGSSGITYNGWRITQSTGVHLYLWTIDATLTSNIVVGYLDGVQSGSNIDNRDASGAFANNTWFLGARNNTSSFWDRPIVGLWAWTRLLLPFEILSFSLDPFAAFRMAEEAKVVYAKGAAVFNLERLERHYPRGVMRGVLRGVG